MSEFSKIEDQIKDILEKYPDCRNSDNILYSVYLSRVNPEVNSVSVSDFYKYFNDYNVPRFESIARIRRKVQSEYPELKGCDTVKQWRRENESKFKQYAIS